MASKNEIRRVRIAGGHGGTVEVSEGQYIAVRDVEGDQTCDFWAFDFGDFDHYLSPPYTIMHIWSLRPSTGDVLVTNRRDPILTIVADDTGWHDLLCPACDPLRYRLHFGVKGHRSCAENFREAVAAYGWGARSIPNPPFNIFMNVAVSSEGRVEIEKPRSKKGDMLIMKAEMDILAVASACPMDLTPSGLEGVTDIELLVGDDPQALRRAAST